MSLLKSLGVRSVAVVPHHASGEARPSRLCACLALAAASAISGTALADAHPSSAPSALSNPACADADSTQLDDGNLKVGKQVVENALALNAVSGGPRIIRMAGTALRSAINPLDLVAETAVGGALGATTGDYKLGKLAGSNASAIMLASAVSPLAAGYLLVSAGRESLAYIEQEKKAAYDEALQETVERICNIREKEAVAYRLAERHSQNDWSPERKSAHEHYINGLIKDSASTGEKNLALITYAQTEAAYVAAGGEPSPWLERYVALDMELEFNSKQIDNQTLVAASTHNALKAGIEGFETAYAQKQNLSAQEKLNQISPYITPESIQSLNLDQAPKPETKASMGL